MAKSNARKTEDEEPEENADAENGTGLLRAKNDLVRKISTIAKWKEISVSKFLDPLLRPIVEAEWAKVRKEMDNA